MSERRAAAGVVLPVHAVSAPAEAKAHCGACKLSDSMRSPWYEIYTGLSQLDTHSMRSSWYEMRRRRGVCWTDRGGCPRRSGGTAHSCGEATAHSERRSGGDREAILYLTAHSERRAARRRGHTATQSPRELYVTLEIHHGKDRRRPTEEAPFSRTRFVVVFLGSKPSVLLAENARFLIPIQRFVWFPLMSEFQDYSGGHSARPL